MSYALTKINLRDNADEANCKLCLENQYPINSCKCLCADVATPKIGEQGVAATTPTTRPVTPIFSAKHPANACCFEQQWPGLPTAADHPTTVLGRLPNGAQQQVHCSGPQRLAQNRTGAPDGTGRKQLFCTLVPHVVARTHLASISRIAQMPEAMLAAFMKRSKIYIFIWGMQIWQKHEIQGLKLPRMVHLL